MIAETDIDAALAETETKVRGIMLERARAMDRVAKSKGRTLAEKVAAKRIAKLIRNEVGSPTFGPLARKLKIPESST